MTIKHDVNEEISSTPYRILYPCSTENRLRSGFYQAIQSAAKEPRLYTELAKQWEDSKADIFDKQGFMWALDPKRIVVIPVKAIALGMPSVPLDVLTKKLCAACKRYGCKDVAISKSHWLNMRYNTGQLQALIDGLEKGGLQVHEYE